MKFSCQMALIAVAAGQGDLAEGSLGLRRDQAMGLGKANLTGGGFGGYSNGFSKLLGKVAIAPAHRLRQTANRI